MLFNSTVYIFLFLPPVVIIYYLLVQKTSRIYALSLLVISSLFFYSWWKFDFLPLLLGSIFFNFIAGQFLLKRKGETFLFFSVAINLFILGYFKYRNFFYENLNLVFSLEIQKDSLVLPLAISFYTFQQIAYLVDNYQGEVRKSSFLEYAAFISFFPQLIAGPIVHHRQLIPQFRKIRKTPNFNLVSKGIYIFSIGLFKKVCIADYLAKFAQAGFDVIPNPTTPEAWISSLSYTLQLYFDFSGYTDMAIGGALLFGITLPINFNSPYKAISIQDFWRRWHITLSNFLRDYIYIPLGGNRSSTYRTSINLFLTFLIGGIWHGASWMFIIWGALHGIAMVSHRFWNRFGFKMPGWAAYVLTFLFIHITWVFFRAKEWVDAKKILQALFLNWNFPAVWNPSLVDVGSPLPTLCVALLLCWFAPNSIQLKDRFKPTIFSLCFALILFLTSILRIDSVSEFLYFNF